MCSSDLPNFFGDYSIYFRQGPLSLIAGHFTFSRIRLLFPHSSFITFLRDPIARTISQFRSWKDPAKMTREWMAAMGHEEKKLFEWIYSASLEEFVRSDHPAIRKAVSNPMTKFLSSDGTADVSSALTNLRKRFATFGIQEEFDESIRLLQSACPWLGPYSLSPTAENHSRIAVDAITPAIRRRIASLNAADIVLYDEARALFRDRVDATPALVRSAA